MKVSKIIISVLILSMLLSFVACKKSTEETVYALTVDNAKIDKGIFSYYLDTQIKTKDDNISKSEAIKNAENLCANYVFVNTEFETRNLELTAADKAEIATSVEDKWNLYGDYYKKIGVTKDIVTKIMTSEYCEDLLISSVFGDGGDKEISKEKQKEYFEENYIAFKTITAYLSGNEEEDKTLKETFEGLKKKVTSENTIDTVNFEYAQSIGASATDTLEVSITKKGSDAYPTNFFTDVFNMETGDLKILTYDSYLFLVKKESVSSYFDTYQNEILESLIGDDFDTLIADLYKDVKVTGTTNIEENCYKTIKDFKTK